MICEACKEREASILFTQILGNEKQTLRLCSQCSEEYGGKSSETSNQYKPEMDAKPKSDKPIKTPASTKKVGVQKVNVVIGHLSLSETADISECKECGMTYDEFRKIGRFGCTACYRAFATQLERLFLRIHRATRHGGKGLQDTNTDLHEDIKLEELRQALQQAVTDEAYEKAATLRDKIAGLTGDSSDADATV